jgi:hypothetical protein
MAAKCVRGIVRFSALKYHEVKLAHRISSPLFHSMVNNSYLAPLLQTPSLQVNYYRLKAGSLECD